MLTQNEGCSSKLCENFAFKYNWHSRNLSKYRDKLTRNKSKRIHVVKTTKNNSKGI